MPDPTEGGLRDRLVFESAHRYLRHGLTLSNDWFNAAAMANSLEHSVRLESTPATAASKITPNLITVTRGPMDPVADVEIGSGLTEDHTELWVTIYAENEAIGTHLQGDCYGILAGKMPSIGFEDAGFTVYDWRAHPPADLTYPPAVDELFRVELERIATDREHDPETGVERDTWYVVANIIEER